MVVATRDRLALLRQAVASVLAQSGGPYQLVVVDDASSDGTPSWLASLDDPRVVVASPAARSERSAARNRGLVLARARYVLFLDDDDRLHPGALARLAGALDGHPAAVAAVGGVDRFDGRGQHRRRSFPRWPATRAVWPEVLAGWVAVGGQTLFRAEAVRAVGGFAEELAVAEDQDLWLRLSAQAQGARATFVPRTVLHQRAHGPAPAALAGSPEAGAPGLEAPDVPVAHRVRAEDVEAAMRARFVAGRPPAERPRAEALVAARGQLQAATVAFEEARFRDAAVAITRALVLAPSLAASPVVGPGLVLSLAKAAGAGALPPPAGLAARRGLRRLRGARGRDPAA